MLVFSHFFCWTMGVLLECRNLQTNILPLSLLQSCKYDDFYSIFNVGKNRGVTPKQSEIKPSRLTNEKVVSGEGQYDWSCDENIHG